MPEITSKSLGGVQDAVMPIAALVLHVTQALVGEPDRVTVEPVSGAGGTVLVLTVAPSDLGKTIGREGRTAESLRSIVRAAGRKTGQHLELDIRSDGTCDHESLPGI